MTTGIERIAAKARLDKNLCFTSLAHHITTEQLEQSLRRIPKNSSAGIDGQGVEAAKAEFDQWSKEMIGAMHRRGYCPPPSRRVYLPKPGKDEKRPISIPTIADRTLQSATAQVLNAIYEQDFLDCSFGGRTGKSAHQALATLHLAISGKKVNWLYDADLKNFFGSLNHGWVEQFLSKRVGDPRILTLIRRWLKAGIIEDGEYQQSETGAAQGGPISVLISNLYLHYVLDLWIKYVVKPQMKGEIYYIRYLDDFVVGFEYHADAIRFQRVIARRLEKFSLAIAPDKTKLIQFGRYAAKWAAVNDKKKVETFCFLGFRLYCSTNKRGNFKVSIKTEKGRLHRSCTNMKLLLRKIRHRPICEQAKAINQRLTGHYRYYGVAGNSGSLERLHRLTVRYWRKMLSSRSQKGRLNWQKYNNILKLFPLPRPRLYIPYSRMDRLACL